MITWMLRTVLATAALAGAAALGDLLARRAGLARRPVWAVALAVAAALPLLAALLPATSPGGALALPPEALSALTRGGGTVVRPARAFPATLLLQSGWLLASAALLGMLVYAAWRLRRLCASWPTVRIEGDEVVLSTGVGPLVVGLVRPRLVVPAWVITAPEAERRMVLAHEREHVRAGDARLLAAAALVSALAPWNLPAWWLVRRLREAVETDCDRRVLAGGFAPADYGRLLLNTAAGARFGLVPGAALAEPKRLLERRLIAMTHTVSDRRVRRLLPLALGAAALLIVACEVARPDAGAPASPVAPKASVAQAAATPLPGTAPEPLEPDPRLVEVREMARAGKVAGLSVEKLQGDEALVHVTMRDGKTVSFKVHVRDRRAESPEALEEDRGLAEKRVKGEGSDAQDVGALRDEVVATKTANPQAVPHVFVDGTEVPEMPKSLDAGRIAQVNVLKAEAASRFWAERHMPDDGRAVVLITTKDPPRN